MKLWMKLISSIIQYMPAGRPSSTINIYQSIKNKSDYLRRKLKMQSQDQYIKIKELIIKRVKANNKRANPVRTNTN